jgi:hypothetical protein
MLSSSLRGLALSALFAAASAQLSVSKTDDATAMAQALVGPGVKVVRASFTGASGSAGTFSKGPQGIRNGLVLSTGNVQNVGLVDSILDISHSLGTPGSSLCDSLSGGGSHDAAVLSMDVELGEGFTGLSASFVCKWTGLLPRLTG